MTLTFTDSGELRRQILADPYLPGTPARTGGGRQGRILPGPGDDDGLLEIDRLAGRGLVRFYFETGNASMRMEVPEDTARSIARWILDHTQGDQAA